MCTLCRRNLLAGERYRRWEPEIERGGRAVCMLCEPEAAKAGWTRTPGEPEREGTAGLRSTVRALGRNDGEAVVIGREAAEGRVHAAVLRPPGL